MKRVSLVIFLLLTSIFALPLKNGEHFVAPIPFGNGTVTMNFHTGLVPGDGWYCSVGSQEYNKPAVDSRLEGELIIPDAVTYQGINMEVLWISRGSFQSCPKLTKIHLPAKVLSISDLSFQGCSSLREITIPVCCEVIYPRAFIGCTALRRVTFLSDLPPKSYNNDTFDEVTYSTATLVVPAQSSEEYLKNPISYRFRFHAETLPIYKDN